MGSLPNGVPRGLSIRHDGQVTPPGRRPSAERIAEAAHSYQDLDAFARAVFDAVGGDVPFDFACLATTDPASELITRAVKSRPLPIGDEEFAAAEYGGPDLNQFAEIARRPVPVGVLSIDSGGDVQRCQRFRSFMTPRFGFTDELRLVCRAQSTTWGALALYRGAGGPPFTAGEGGRLAAVGPLIADGIRGALFADTAASPRSRGAAVLILDPADRVTDVTAAAHAQIAELGGWDNESLPTNVLAAAAHARATGRSANTRVLGRSGQWLLLQAMALSGGSGRSVVVSIDMATPASVGQIALAARGLTTREQDVAQLVLQGASTRAIAASLFLSPHTVQDHLKAIFRKLGVSSRREMIARLVAG